MKHLSFFIAIWFTFFPFTSEAQTDFWERTDGPYDAIVYTLVSNSDGHLFAGTNRGIFRSTDQGQHWSEIGVGVSLLENTSIRAIFILPNGDILVSNFFDVFRSTDKGNTWIKTGFNTKEIRGFARNPTNGELFAALGFALDGSVYRSTDNGLTWTPTGLSGNYVYTVAIAANGGLFAGTKNGIFRSTDNGVTWKLINAGLPSSITVDALFIDDTNGTILAGTSRGIYRSVNNGDSWTAASMSSIWVYSFARSSENNIVAGTSNGLFQSTDNGNSWTPVGTDLVDIDVYTLATYTKEEIFAGTSHGVFHSTNHGNDWQQLNKGLVAFTVASLAINQTNNTLFAGTTRSVFRSTDDGEHWEDISLNVPFFDGNEANSMFILPNGDVLAANFFDVFRSTDNGNNWHQTGFTPEEVNDFTLHPNGEELFAALGFVSRGGVYHSTNNGLTWTPTGLTGLFVYTIEVAADGTLFAGTKSGIFRSTNKGETWELINIGLPANTSVYAFFINDVSGAILAGTSRGIFRSEDGGISWTPTIVNVSTSVILGNVDGHIFAGTHNGVFRSMDDGISWALLNTGLTSTSISALAQNKEGRLFAGTLEGEIFRSKESVTSIHEISSGIPLNFSLEQNYPNPLNYSTSIAFSIPQSTQVKIRIYNLTGQLVRTLLNERKTTGHYEVSWNGQNETGKPVSPGVYLYDLEAGNFRAIRRLVVAR